MDEHQIMARCEQLAAAAKKAGNSPVGSVVVLHGVIIGEGIESATSDENITRHAEMKALQQARQKVGKDLSEATLYSTHEPCVMCAYAARFHRIRKVVYQQSVTPLGSVSSNFNLLTSEEVPDSWGTAPEVIHLKKG